MITYAATVHLDHKNTVECVWCDTCRRWGKSGWAHACNVNFYPTIKELVASFHPPMPGTVPTVQSKR